MHPAPETRFEFRDETLIPKRPTVSRLASKLLEHDAVVLSDQPGRPTRSWSRPRLGQWKQHGIAANAAVSRSAAPWIIFSLAHHGGAHRIALHVSNGSPQMRFIEGAREEPPLPQAAAYSELSIDVLRVARVDRLEHHSQALDVCGNAHKVYMIGHKAVGKDLQPRLVGVLDQELEITLPVFVAEEYVLATIAPLSDMVREAGDYDSGDSGHKANPPGDRFD